jgi:hypothetical protein
MAKGLPVGKRPNIPDTAEATENTPYSLGNRASLEAKKASSDSGVRSLEWQEVNAATWRLIDPDAPQLRLLASHGQWGGYEYPKALAYVFDVGLADRDWRIRVRKRGNQWRAFGCVIDLATAKRIAQEAVENPAEPKPARFSVPLNLGRAQHRWVDGPMLDPQTLSYIRRVEIGGVLVEAPNTPASGDDEWINTCATDEQVEQQRLRDLADESMDEALAQAFPR